MTAEIREHRNQEYLKFTLDVLVLLYGILRSIVFIFQIKPEKISDLRLIICDQDFVIHP